MPNLGNWLWNALYTLGGVAGIAVTALFFLQNKLIYVPRLPGVPPDLAYFPNEFGMEFEDIWLTAADGVALHAWLMWPRHWGSKPRRERPIVIFFQENAGNMSFRLPFLRLLTRMLDCSAFILSYRGYGRSGGSPSEAGLKLDAQAAVEHVLGRADVDPGKLILSGRSLGGAVALYAADRYRHRVKGVVVENTFTSLSDVVGKVFPPLGLLIGKQRPCNFLVRNNWDNRRTVERLTSLPILYLSSLMDEMLPPYQMRELYDVHPKLPWQLVVFPTGTHIETYESAATEYWPAVRHFVEAVLAQPAVPEGGERVEQAVDGEL